MLIEVLGFDDVSTPRCILRHRGVALIVVAGVLSRVAPLTGRMSGGRCWAGRCPCGREALLLRCWRNGFLRGPWSKAISDVGGTSNSWLDASMPNAKLSGNVGFAFDHSHHIRAAEVRTTSSSIQLRPLTCSTEGRARPKRYGHPNIRVAQLNSTKGRPSRQGRPFASDETADRSTAKRRS